MVCTGRAVFPCALPLSSIRTLLTFTHNFYDAHLDTAGCTRTLHWTHALGCSVCHNLIFFLNVVVSSKPHGPSATELSGTQTSFQHRCLRSGSGDDLSMIFSSALGANYLHYFNMRSMKERAVSYMNGENTLSS